MLEKFSTKDHLDVNYQSKTKKKRKISILRRKSKCNKENNYTDKENALPEATTLCGTDDRMMLHSPEPFKRSGLRIHSKRKETMSPGVPKKQFRKVSIPFLPLSTNAKHTNAEPVTQAQSVFESEFADQKNQSPNDPEFVRRASQRWREKDSLVQQENRLCGGAAPDVMTSSLQYTKFQWPTSPSQQSAFQRKVSAGPIYYRESPFGDTPPAPKQGLVTGSSFLRSSRQYSSFCGVTSTRTRKNGFVGDSPFQRSSRQYSSFCGTVPTATLGEPSFQQGTRRSSSLFLAHRSLPSSPTPDNRKLSLSIPKSHLTSPVLSKSRKYSLQFPFKNSSSSSSKPLVSKSKPSSLWTQLSPSFRRKSAPSSTPVSPVFKPKGAPVSHCLIPYDEENLSPLSAPSSPLLAHKGILAACFIPLPETNLSLHSEPSSPAVEPITPTSASAPVPEVIVTPPSSGTVIPAADQKPEELSPAVKRKLEPLSPGIKLKGLSSSSSSSTLSSSDNSPSTKHTQATVDNSPGIRLKGLSSCNLLPGVKLKKDPLAPLVPPDLLSSDFHPLGILSAPGSPLMSPKRSTPDKDDDIKVRRCSGRLSFDDSVIDLVQREARREHLEKIMARETDQHQVAPLRRLSVRLKSFRKSKRNTKGSNSPSICTSPSCQSSFTTSSTSSSLSSTVSCGKIGFQDIFETEPELAEKFAIMFPSEPRPEWHRHLRQVIHKAGQKIFKKPEPHDTNIPENLRYQLKQIYVY